MGLERPGDVGSDEQVASAESAVCAQLLLYTSEGGVLPQAGCNFSVVLDHNQAKVAVALLEHKVVCLPDLLRGGTKVEPGVGEARLGECHIGTRFLAVFLGLRSSDVGGDGSGPGGSVVGHDE